MKPRELVRACAAGDPRAWKLLVDGYGPWILHVAGRSLPGRESNAEDVVSEVFRLLLERDGAVLKRFSAPYNLRAWLAVLTRRTAGRLLRKLGRDSAAVSEAVATPQREESGVDELMAELPHVDRLILRLYYVDGLSYDEIAGIVGMPVNSIGKRKFRAMEALREIATKKNFIFPPGSGGSAGIPSTER